ncbi:hypothetical protein D3C87_1591070 [compost metagenome]
MNESIGIDRSLRRHQRLRDHLPTEHALPADIRARAAIKIVLQLLQIERLDELFHRVRTRT